MYTQKLIVILGPTSSGKTSLSLKLAKKFNGEIISADSRQVYQNLNIGSGKVSKHQQKIARHHLLDVVRPQKQYSVSQYQRDAKYAAAQITSRGKIPFLVGGTAFYIYSVIDDLAFPKVKPNPKLRKRLEIKSAPELFRLLKKLDPKRAKTIDKHNKRRLIRAIEIIKATGSPVPSLRKQGSNYDFLILGLNPKDIKARIAKNVRLRFKKGLLKEVQNLMNNGVSPKRLNEIGLTYKLAADFLTVHKNARPARRTRLGEAGGGSRKSEYTELADKIITAEQQYAGRQMTWFKRDKRINWITNQKQAEKYIIPFLRK